MNKLVACGNHGACGGLGEIKANRVKANPVQPLLDGLVTVNKTISYSPEKIRELFLSQSGKADAALAFPLRKTIPENDRLNFLIQSKQTLANLWTFLKQALPLNPDAQEEFKKIEPKIVFA